MGSVFVTAINPTGQAFTNCRATLNNMTADSGNFSYRRTNPLTNQPIGNVGDRFDIPPGGMQTWIQFIQPATTHGPQEVQVDMMCDGFTGARAPTVGVDTFSFSVSNSSPLDLVALGATASNDGILRIASTQGAGAFAVSGVNLGISGAVTVTPGTGQTSLPLTLTVCQTNAQGQCLSAPAPSVVARIAKDATPTFSVFAGARQVLPFLPGINRAYLNFYDQSGTLRGRTSVAITVADGVAGGLPQTNTATSTPISTQPTASNAAQSSSLGGTKAISASDLVDTIGVNTHLDFKSSAYQNLSITEAAIDYLGIRNLRDSAQTSADLALWAKVAAATGARFDDYMGEASPAQDLTDLDYVAALAGLGILNFVEGGNENDDSYAVSQGNSLAWTAAFQQQVYTTAHLLGLPVINMSFGAGWTAANNYHGDYDKVGDLSPFTDYANAHTYPNVGATTAASIARLNADALLAAASRPVITTEIGWNNSSFSQRDAARFMLDAVFDSVKAGNVKTYFYALFDDNSGLFGLMNTDGSAKPAGAALHNLTGILADSGAPRTDSLDYVLSGTTANDSAVLTEKSNGAFQITLWNEVDAAHSVTLTLATAASVINVYDPMAGSTPVANYANTALATITIADHPLIVEIVP